MKKILIVLLSASAFSLISCGPSASSMAKKHCDLYEQYVQAEKAGDSTKMKQVESDLVKMDTELTEKYMHKNPEWLLKYVQLKNKCIQDILKK